jgi:hypothetical protein
MFTQDLIGIYDKTVPKETLEILAELIALDGQSTGDINYVIQIWEVHLKYKLLSGRVQFLFDVIVRASPLATPRGGDGKQKGCGWRLLSKLDGLMAVHCQISQRT